VISRGRPSLERHLLAILFAGELWHESSRPRNCLTSPRPSEGATSGGGRAPGANLAAVLQRNHPHLHDDVISPEHLALEVHLLAIVPVGELQPEPPRLFDGVISAEDCAAEAHLLPMLPVGGLQNNHPHTYDGVISHERHPSGCHLLAILFAGELRLGPPHP